MINTKELMLFPKADETLILRCKMFQKGNEMVCICVRVRNIYYLFDTILNVYLTHVLSSDMMFSIALQRNWCN